MEAIQWQKDHLFDQISELEQEIAGLHHEPVGQAPYQGDRETPADDANRKLEGWSRIVGDVPETAGDCLRQRWRDDRASTPSRIPLPFSQTICLTPSGASRASPRPLKTAPGGMDKRPERPNRARGQLEHIQDGSRRPKQPP